MLRMEHLSKIYRTEFVETRALSAFSAHVEAGEFIALMGPSGSGKSTFLNVAGLLDEFEEGSYTLDGVDVRRLGDTERSRIRNQKIGFIFQTYNLLPDLNTFDNIDVPLRYRGMGAAERKQRVEEALEMVGLGGRRKHLPTQLSGGQQQRVAIARAIAGEPVLILADEPTGNLDSVMAEQIMKLLQDINDRGTTIVMVTHDADLARHAQRTIQILDGAVQEPEAVLVAQP